MHRLAFWYVATVASTALANQRQDTRLAVIHISLVAYPYLVLPIVQLLFHNPHDGPDGGSSESTRPWAFWHPFVNISITADECSIVCPRRQAEELFVPLIAGLRADIQDQVSISKEDYSAIVIDGEGLEAGRRVLDLTSPLALAGM